MSDNPAFAKIEADIKSNDVVLYMKGSKEQPICGFSGAVVQMLRAAGLEEFKDVDVLSSPEIREAIKAYNNWPTIPQLFVKGEFVGGGEIIKEMFETGELREMFESKGVELGDSQMPAMRFVGGGCS